MLVSAYNDSLVRKEYLEVGEKKVSSDSRGKERREQRNCYNASILFRHFNTSIFKSSPVEFGFGLRLHDHGQRTTPSDRYYSF